jgi:hypothetical protein
MPKNDHPELSEIIADVKRLTKPLGRLERIKANQPDALAKMEKALESLPASRDFTALLEETVARAREWLKLSQAARAESAGVFLKQYVEDARSRTDVREGSSGRWRIGPLTIEFDRARVRARAFYNDEVVVAWKPITKSDNIQELETAARKLLDDGLLNETDSARVFWEGYRWARRRMEKAQKGTLVDRKDVPIRDFVWGLRMAMVNSDLERLPWAKIKKADFPKSSVLYNIDWYRRRSKSIPEDRRLVFTTGSQAMAKTGLLLNGLDPKDDPVVLCWVKGPVK